MTFASPHSLLCFFLSERTRGNTRFSLVAYVLPKCRKSCISTNPQRHTTSLGQHMRKAKLAATLLSLFRCSQIVSVLNGSTSDAPAVENTTAGAIDIHQPRGCFVAASLCYPAHISCLLSMISLAFSIVQLCTLMSNLSRLTVYKPFIHTSPPCICLPSAKPSPMSLLRPRTSWLHRFGTGGVPPALGFG